MIFDLPPLLGLIPLLLYIVLLLKGANLVFATFATVVVAAIFTGQTLQSFGAGLVEGMGSFLAVIGFIVILGAGLGKVLTKTGIAQTLVHFILDIVGIKTKTRAIIAICIASSLLTAMLGTSNGAIAILAPIIIPVVAKLGFTRSSVGVLLHGSASTGLFLGPFTPPTVTTLGLAGIDYGTYMISVGIPVSALILLCTFFMTKYTMKVTKNDPENFYNEEDYDMHCLFTPTPESRRGTMAFGLAIAALVGYGVVMQAGASFAVVVILLSGVVVGLTCKIAPKDFVSSMIEGASLLLMVFFTFVLCHPMVKFISETGAFTALAEMMVPVAESAGSLAFAIIVTLIGVFGISGAAVAQQQIIHGMFLPTVIMLNFPMDVWALILLVGSQITSFVIPGGDIYAPMSLARSTDVKSMLRNGYVIALVTIGYVVVRSMLI